MATSSKREREIARAHYERQQARRQHKVDRRKRRRKIFAASMCVLVAIGTGTALTLLLNSGDDSQTISPSAQPSASASASASTSAEAAAALCPKPTGTPGPAQSFKAAPPLTIDKTASYTAKFATNCGDITVALEAAKAPNTVNSFAFLAGKKYFDGTKCHRLTTEGIYVLQCGDPTATGSGGPGYGFGIENAPKDGVFPAGTVAMARSSDPNSNGSQFFIVYKDSTLPTTGGGYTIFGKVTDGLEVVQKVASAGSDESGGTGDGKPKQGIVLEKVTTTKQ